MGSDDNSAELFILTGEGDVIPINLLVFSGRMLAVLSMRAVKTFKTMLAVLKNLYRRLVRFGSGGARQLVDPR